MKRLDDNKYIFNHIWLVLYQTILNIYTSFYSKSQTIPTLNTSCLDNLIKEKKMCVSANSSFHAKIIKGRVIFMN